MWTIFPSLVHYCTQSTLPLALIGIIAESIFVREEPLTVRTDRGAVVVGFKMTIATVGELEQSATE